MTAGYIFILLTPVWRDLKRVIDLSPCLGYGVPTQGGEYLPDANQWDTRLFWDEAKCLQPWA